MKQLGLPLLIPVSNSFSFGCVYVGLQHDLAQIMHAFWLSGHDAHYSVTEPSCLTCVLCGRHVYEEEMICYQKRILFRFSIYVSDANVLKYKYNI